MATASKKSRSEILKIAIGEIAKKVDQKPLQPSFETKPHVPSGSTLIDTLIGGTPTRNGKGRICPGYPREMMTELFGAFSSGKSTLALCAIAQIQKAGGAAMFLDYENALQHDYARNIGVSFDEDKLAYYTPNTLEEGFKMIYIMLDLCRQAREQNAPAPIDLIVIDSVAAMIPQDELEKKIDDPAKIGILASKLAQNLPKVVQWLKGSGVTIILLNQERDLIQSMSHGENTNTAGGKALKFYVSNRLKLTRIKGLQATVKDPFTGKDKNVPYGNIVQVKNIKNRVDARQGQTTEIFIRYGYGVDDYYSIVEAGIIRKLIQKSGAWLDYQGNRAASKEKMRDFLMKNPNVFEDLKKKVQESILTATLPSNTEDIDDDRITSIDGADDDDIDLEALTAPDVPTETVEAE